MKLNQKSKVQKGQRSHWLLVRATVLLISHIHFGSAWFGPRSPHHKSLISSSETFQQLIRICSCCKCAHTPPSLWSPTALLLKNVTILMDSPMGRLL